MDDHPQKWTEIGNVNPPFQFDRLCETAVVHFEDCPPLFLTLIEGAMHTQRNSPGGSTRRPSITRTDILVTTVNV